MTGADELFQTFLRAWCAWQGPSDQNSKCYERTQHLIENTEGRLGKPSKYFKNKLVIPWNPASI